MTPAGKTLDRALTFVLVVGLTALVSWVCKSSSSPTAPAQAKANPLFAADIQPIFTASCATSGCHAGAGAAGLVLSAGQSYAAIVSVNSTQEPARMRVSPGDAANSYLVVKLENRQTVGGRMPPSGPLAAASIQNIKNWINQGAINN